jgi:hypothetical protein
MILSVLADFADIIAALAIILSLIFVGYELHQNRTQAELQTGARFLTPWSTTRADPRPVLRRVHHPRACRLWRAQRHGPMRFGLYLEQGIHIFGNFLKHNNSLPRKLEGLEDAVTNHVRRYADNTRRKRMVGRSADPGRFMAVDLHDRERPPSATWRIKTG